MAKRKRRAFTKEFKAEAVRVVRESGKTVGAVARELGAPERDLLPVGERQIPPRRRRRRRPEV